MKTSRQRIRHLRLARECKRIKRETLQHSQTDPSQSSYQQDSSSSDEIYYLSSDLSEIDVHELEENFLKWNEKAEKRRFRAVYHGDSRTTLCRRNKLKKAKEESLKNDPKIFSFFKKDVVGPDIDVEEDYERNECLLSEEMATEIRESMTIEDAILALTELTNVTSNAKQAKKSANVSKFDLIRYMAILSYLKLLQSDKTVGKMKASREVAASLFPKRKVNGTSRRIRQWAQQYLESQTLTEHRQGKHVKTKSLVEDEDVKAACRNWLQSQQTDSITALSFSNWVCENLWRVCELPRPVSISERTATRWLGRLNYRFREYRKGLYFDGHGRPDVVAYRESFLKRMESRLPFIATFEGDEMETMVMPDISDDQKRIVVVTHDESCFDSHDGKKTVWMDEDNMPIRPKSGGRSIMVSEFLCECHGPMKLLDEQRALYPEQPYETVQLIQPGKNGDGYWKNVDLVRQLELRAIPIFKILHPNCIGLFIFDNSQNHHALAPDALRASVLNLKDGGKNVVPQRDGFFMLDGVKYLQSMQREDGVQKGIVSILKERGLWQAGLRLADARKLLQEQPDFQEQREWLEETAGRFEDCIIDFYPKFHCEFNFIELYWGQAKRYTRRNCDYSFAGLQRAVPEALRSVPLSLIRKYARKCFRYMDAYRPKGEEGARLSMKQVQYAMKKYTSHRCIPDGVMDDLELHSAL
jgi:hypothetical protein